MSFTAPDQINEQEGYAICLQRDAESQRNHSEL